MKTPAAAGVDTPRTLAYLAVDAGRVKGKIFV